MRTKLVDLEVNGILLSSDLNKLSKCPGTALTWM